MRYPVTGLPPSVVGAAQVSITELSLAVAIGPTGCPGTVSGVAVTTADDAPEPATFVARTRKTYTLPLANPDTVVVSAFTVVIAVHDAPPSRERSTV
jgi:NAD(P)H-dependent flavin oxidoreductase YrpB (nitropropane dioxygenase family)